MQRELFRAKEQYIDNWVISDSIEWSGDMLLLKNKDGVYVNCDANTRSVSYPNMIDKNGKNIFASLSEDGVGGDILLYKGVDTSRDEYKPYWYNSFDVRKIAKVIDNDFIASTFEESKGVHYTPSLDKYEVNRYEVIGIHKGE